ncbi:MAG: cytochrome c biogenesis protein CcdA [candidate division KSB1 bacterium]|nr:cytochrome c biogenesis protein CcdA [candidate division KSB1 bacterium]MDZ7364391.1 cytochrome c biogenesis protein CcdA [candidate division KSB1 bacterium]MDZ7402763.1 cytochrome c biogenesis protein CcdA [candidate division KSB1 bacterium]
METNITYLAALFAGLISFISPCVLPLVPAYISFISGVSVEDLRKAERRQQTALRLMASSLLFISGFTVVFVLLGATATVVGNFLLQNLGFLSKAAGVVLIIFGLHVAGLIKIPFLNYEARFQTGGKPTSTIGAFLVGSAFAFGWTPCIGPILGAILAIAGSQDTVGKGMLLLLVYSIGLGIPFFLTAAATQRLLSAMNRVKKHFKTVEIVSGAFLILVGIMMFFNLLTALNSILVRWFPWLTKIG